MQFEKSRGVSGLVQLMVYAVLLATLAACSRSDPTQLLAHNGALAATSLDVARPESTPAPTNDVESGSRNTHANSPLPTAFVERDSFDFGSMPPDADGVHEFIVKNNGNSDLILREGATTCQCTSIQFPKDPIKPNASGVVTVKWTTLPKGEFYQQASVRTNDPQHQELRFTVHGSIAHHLAWSATPFVVGDISPNDGRSHRIMVYSQVHDHFVLERLECSWEGVQFTTTPATTDELRKLHGKSGYIVNVTLPSGLDPGYFDHWMRAYASFESDEESIVAETKLSGKILRRLCVYGKGVDPQGRLLLGRLTPGTQHVFRYLLKVRDDDRILTVKNSSISPTFIDVDVKEMEVSGTIGLYEMTLTIPADAPTGVYRSVDGAGLSMEFNHPRIHDLNLSLDFSLMPAH